MRDGDGCHGIMHALILWYAGGYTLKDGVIRDGDGDVVHSRRKEVTPPPPSIAPHRTA